MPTSDPLDLPEGAPLTRRGAPLVVVLGLVLLPVLLAGAAVLWTWAFVLIMHARRLQYARHTGLLLPKRSLLRQALVLWREVWALLQAQAWRLWTPWMWRPWRPPTPQGHAVVCLHGFTQDGSNFHAIRRRLHARGRATWAPSLGYPPRNVERYVVALQGVLEEVLAATDGPIDLVCHSMGGVILRATLARRPDLAARVARVVTLGSPHRGTAASRGIRLPETVFLGRRSQALGGLPTLSELLPHAVITSVGSLDDTTVYPEDSTRAGSEEHVTLEGIGHAGLLVHAISIAHVERALERPWPPRSP